MSEVETPMLRYSAAVTVYSSGLVACSVCVKTDVPREEIERAVNAQNPTGISSSWEISDESFADGTPNPSPCNDFPDRLHYLLNC